MKKDDLEKMKKIIADKKAKSIYVQYEDKIGSGTVEERNKNRGNKATNSKKIVQ